MEDPWAAWGKPSAPADKMRMPTSTPSPEPVDLDPWAKSTVTPKPPRSPSPTRFSPKSPSKLSQVTLSSSPLSTGLGFQSRVPKLDGWDDVGWGTPKPAPAPAPAPPDEHGRLRSPSLDLDAGWGEPSKPMPAEQGLEREPSPSPPTSTSPRKSVEALSRVLSTDLRLSGELPRVSLEAEAFSRPGSADLPPLSDSRPGSVSFESPRVSEDVTSPSPPAVPSVAFDTADLGAGFATPFSPTSPKEPKLGVPPELERSASFGSDFGGFADVDVEDEDAGGWGDTSWKDEGGWKEEAYGGWGDVPRAESPPKQTQQELDWEAAQRRLAAADARAPHERVMRLRRGWEEVAEIVIGENKLEASEEAERALDDNARTLQEDVGETLRGLTEVPDTSFTFGHSATRERYAQALSRAPPNTMTLLRAPRQRRAEGGGLDFGPGLEGWAARSRLGEPEAAGPAIQAEPEQAKGWGFWRRQATPKPLVTSGGGVLEVKTDIDTAGIASGPAPARSKPPSIASRPGTPADPRPSTSARASIASVPRAGSISSPSPLSGPAEPVLPPDMPDKKAETSRMSRLFRWGRKEERKEEEDKDKEFELGESDFAFLDQVPSMAGPDLLGGGMSIDEVLSLKKEVPLPAPLAPPPRSGSTSGRPSMGAPPRNDAFDLFSSLDFDDVPAPAKPTQSSSSGFAWDDLRASTPASAVRLSPPRIATPPLQPLRAPTPPVRGSLQPGRTATPPIMGTGLQPTHSATPPLRPTLNPPMPLNPPTPERPRYGPSGPALGAHARHGSSASGMGGMSRKKATSPPPPPKDFGFGDLNFGLDPPPSPPKSDLFGMAALAPSPPPSGTSVEPLAPSPPPMGTGMGIAALAPAQPPAASRMGMGMAALAPSLPPSMGMSMAALAPSPPPGMGGMAPLRPGIAALTPSPPPISHPASFAVSPPPSASPSFALPPFAFQDGSVPPPALETPSAHTMAPPASDDDFGDFGDFGNFDAPTTTDDDFGDFADFGDSTSVFNAASTGFDTDATPDFGSFNAPAYSSFGAPRPQPQPAQPAKPESPPPTQRSPQFDPFDFTAFESLTPAKAPSSAAPTPIAKSIPPTPIEKSPGASAFSALPGHASAAGASLSRNSSLSRTMSHSPPVFVRPIGLPTGLTKSRQSSFADSAAGRPLPVVGASPTPTSRRTPSVDHRATLTLMAAVHAKDGVGEVAPLSPVVEPLSPPPTRGPQGFSALLPPPPGGVRRPAGRGLIDLLDD
ncbi:uncharacterized protein CcaverHIS019_0108010 [Cutaneotrichosporon cavernicola]|uniref:Uncharacterized protein n=1 Tax=Cutaneotrichosporon cavernicola TaxID=279322 RepID=A0AA48II17_9TREE|nr:uncharacterized protein CcaverHIS019_0108010 [Cutaneotrichosporon cavernicola]BEI88083.1 hypothetical protein CcaverHIS019_0108010 [Cutaneotrichosporon cavernicola]